MRTSPHFPKVFALLLCFGLLCLAMVPLTTTTRAKAAGTQRTATSSEISVTTPDTLATADFNGDNYPDLVVNQFTTTNKYISVVLSNGTGGYLTPTQFPIGPINDQQGPNFVSFANDFNNDGKNDIAVVVFGGGVVSTTQPPGYIKFFPGLGNGSFDAPVTSGPIGGSLASYTRDAAVGDLNGDSKLDIIFCTLGPGPFSHGSTVSWAYGNGGGGFADGGEMQVNNNARGVATGDFTGDGKLDIAVQSNGDNCPTGGFCMSSFQSLIGDGTGNFVRNILAPVGSFNMKVGDFNNDGKLDVFSGNGILIGDGAGGFGRSTELPGTGTFLPSSGSETALGDFNQDGKLDGAMIVGSKVILYFGNGVGGITTTHYFYPGLDPQGLAAADFDHNGKIDLAIAAKGENKIRIFYDDVLSTIGSSHVYDFDGDGRTDIAVYRPGSPAAWYLLRSSDNTFQAVGFGTAGDIPVAADYSGDGRVEIAVYRPSEGVWYTSNYPTDAGFTFVRFGLPTDLPVVGGDYNGDGKADRAVYRVTGGVGTFYSTTTTQLGTTGDQPVVGDFDGDGKTDVAVYRPGATATAESFWHIRRSSDQVLSVVQFGLGEDKPVAGDFDGDHVTNIAVFRPSIGYWFTSLDPGTNYGGRQWGQSGDVPMTGDFDGDAKIDLSVYRSGAWYILTSSNSAFVSYGFGIGTDKPVPAMSLP